MRDLAREVVGSITVETTLFPPFTITDPFAPSPASEKPNAALSFLRPKITIAPRSSAFKPVSVAPYGEPGAPIYWMVQVGAVIGVVALAFYLTRR